MQTRICRGDKVHFARKKSDNTHFVRNDEKLRFVLTKASEVVMINT